jgi:hypothetical protein
MKGLNLRWTRHLKESDKQSFESAIRNSTVMIDRCIELLKEELRELDQKEFELLDDVLATDVQNKLPYLLGQKKQAIKWLHLFEGIYHDQ